MASDGAETAENAVQGRRRPRVVRALSPKGFMEIAADEVDRALRYDRPLSILMIQVGGALRIRKANGVNAAEELVAGAAEMIGHSLRRIDRLARLGPAEFGVLLPETRLGNAEIVAVRMRDHFAEVPLQTRSGPQSVSLNVGISTINPRMRNARTFLLLACAELRRARMEGAGAIRSAPPDLVRVSVARNASIH
ncbi:MAG: GGDEF domain-containing protein [Paracoccaceae bacterium]